jgi:hypothetical protein
MGIERLHADCGTRLHDRGQLKGFSLPEDVFDGLRADQDLHGRNPPVAVLFDKELLRHDTPQRFTDHGFYLCLLVCGERHR